MSRPHRSAPHARLRLPAFGRELLELRRKGLVPNPRECIVCIDNWKWATNKTRVVVAPDADPALLDFSMLADLDVTVPHSLKVTPPARRDALLRALVRANPRRIYALDMDLPAASFFVKSVAAGVERQEYA